jgi:DNA primase
MSSQVDQIKERLAIQDVVSAYIKIEKTGANYKARCPFHNEKTPSFFISPARNSYYCFGCGAKGDIFSFVQEFEGLDFMGSLKVLAEKSGIELVKENPKTRSERERLYLCLESAAIFFQKNLYTKEKNREVVDYLTGRGLTKETIKEWRVGFSEDSWRSLLTYLKEKKFTERDMEKAGLIKKKDQTDNHVNFPSSDYYDRFRGRIMFPLFDSSGRVIAFSGRIFKGDEKSAKYLNSPETELFSKSHFLYGFHKAKTAIREQDLTILVEGQMDLIMSHQAGIKNTVAVSGTALTENHLEMVKRLSNNVCLAFDPDSAGVKAAERSARIALSLGMEARAAQLPKGEDPALYILNHKEKWQEIINNAKHIINFTLDHLLSLGLDQRKLSHQIISQVLPFVVELQSSMEKSHFVGEIQHKTGIKEDAIWDDLKKVEQKILAERKNENSSFLNERNLDPDRVEENPLLKKNLLHKRRNAILRKIVGIIYWQKSLAVSSLGIEELEKRLEEIIGKEERKKAFEEFEKEKNELILEAEISFEHSERLQKEIDEFFIHLSGDYLKEQFAEALRHLALAEEAKDAKKTKEMLQKCKELSDKINQLPKFT